MPNWREALKELEAEMKAHPQHEAPLPKPESVSPPQTESKPAPLKTEAKVEAKPVVKKSAPAAKPKAKPAAKPKASAKKKK